MEKEVFSFFEEKLDRNRPLLIGYSGGPDSACLLELIVKWGRMAVHLVHVDHGWRKESAQELERIKDMAQKRALALHAMRLDLTKCKENLECYSRNERLKFFIRVAKEVDAQGILLGHHADDQAETVLKRVLEGSSLPFFSAMKPVSAYNSLNIFRPMLNIRKQEILAWLKEHQVSYFEDPTNLDPKFLRGSFRTKLFPELKASFGKEFENNLCLIAKEAQELQEYLDRCISPFLEQAVDGPWGTFLPSVPNEALHLRYLVKKLAPHFSRFQVEKALELLKVGAANKQIEDLSIDRGRAFFGMRQIPALDGELVLTEGSFSFGNWNVLVRPIQVTQELGTPEPKNSLIDAWRGTMCTYIQSIPALLRLARKEDRRLLPNGSTKRYERYVSEKKVPHFLTHAIPVIATSSGIVEDFLTGEALVTERPKFQVDLVEKTIIRLDQSREDE